MTDFPDVTGFLEVAGDGTITSAPAFLSDALEWDSRGIDNIWSMFDTESIPHLTVTRVIGGRNFMEMHVSVVTDQSIWGGFRFWDCSDEEQVRFFFVDDRAIHRTHEWEYRRLRDYILSDVQNFVMTQFKNRLSTLHALTEVLRDNPDAARGSAERILEVFSEFETVVDELSIELDEEDMANLGVLIRAIDTPRIVASWSEETVTVEATLGDVDEAFWIDSALLESVLYPIVQNAVESNPSDELVRIHVDRLQRAPMLAFEIVDNGVGMTSHELDRAEDPFFTTKKGHVGLGLARAKFILRQIGGYWNIKSSRKSGTTVRICVPIRGI